MASLLSRLTHAVKTAIGLYTDHSVTQASSLLSGLYPSAWGAIPDRGTRRTLESYSEMPWLRAVASKVATNVAATHWELYAPTSGRREQAVVVQRAAKGAREPLLTRMVQAGDLQPVTQHVFLDALANANEFMVGSSLWRVTQVHLDLVGEAFWIKERNGVGAPVGFWPIPPNWVLGTPTPSHRAYRVGFLGWKGEIPDTEILWFSDADPANPYGRGTGLARSLADELETDEYAARFQRMTFLNRARPDLIVYPKETKQHAGVITEENAEILAERWRAEHQGFWRAALPYFATREIGVHEIGQTFQELQLTDLRKHERDIIVQVWGLPPEELGILESSNRATIDGADYLFKKNLIVPRLEFLRSHLQERLLPEYDERLVLDYVSPVQEDHAAKLEAVKVAPYALSVDELRALSGHAPLADGRGQVYVMPINVAPVPDPTVPPPSPVIAAHGAPHVQRDISGEPIADTKVCKDASDLMSAATLRQADEENPDDLPDLALAALRKETSVRRLLQQHLRELQENTDLADLARAVAASNVDAAVRAVPFASWRQRVEPDIVEFLREAFVVGARQGAEVAHIHIIRDVPGVEWNRVNPEALVWAQAHAGELLTDVVSISQEAVRQATLYALQLGWGAEKAARALRASVGLTAMQALVVQRYAERLAELEEMLQDDVLFARVGRYSEALMRQRALTIARTEIMTSANQGQHRLWQVAIERGVLIKDRLERVWLATAEPEELCLALDQTTASMDEPFQDGTMLPPRHVNCLPSDSLVSSGGRIAATSERWYEGDVVIISTAGGKKLTSTPNHPILTDRGWMAAGMIHEGQQVVSSEVCGGMTLSNSNDIDRPTRIQEVTDAYRVKPAVRGCAVMTSTPHFHGDGMDGHIAVIWADSALRDNVEAVLVHDSPNEMIKWRLSSSALPARCEPYFMVKRLLGATHRAVGRLGQMVTLLAAHSCPALFITGADRGAALVGCGGQGQSLAFRHGLHASLGGIATPQARRRPGASRDVARGNQSADLQTLYAVPSRDHLERIAGHIGVDRVIGVERNRYVGLVHNMETSAGWYVAQGIVTHNCRCSIGIRQRQKAARLAPAVLSLPDDLDARVRQAVQAGFASLASDLERTA